MLSHPTIGNMPPVDAPHIPVMWDEVRDALQLVEGGRYVDGTFGAGGYTRGILDGAPKTHILAIDRDPRALELGAKLVTAMNGRLLLKEGTFGHLEDIARDAEFAPVQGVVLDIGVSSMQIDEAQRGFSFMHDGPLDMRMSQSGTRAQDLINSAPEAHLADVLYYYGEERLARPIARAIVAARLETPIVTTKQLVDVVQKVIYPRPNAIHPATRTFQALRIAVNDELGELVSALYGAERLLEEGARLVVVTFHSLEDRIVKQFFAARSGKTPSNSRHAPYADVRQDPSFALVGKQPITASDHEIKRNPRSRSAKLRFGIRTSAPIWPEDDSLMRLAQLPTHTLKRGR